ncbi:hypothetical protein VP01_1255g4 [Puccinia sorghi]|uniref:Uncharacterized protein n=1 Tax=Puccinia sorghi TaxID=27349 RepID=A0A0L6VPB9_9BASI|nr:hypothetical protein VP01_1255g4 [Puccinia sorghi]
MGIPKVCTFFRWMTQKYPVVLHQVVKGDRIPQIGQSISHLNNLYLDLNGIIHHCSHPSDPRAIFEITELEIFSGIFASLEHLFTLAQPRRLFFIAVDGVAPRAKMNEQVGTTFFGALGDSKPPKPTKPSCKGLSELPAVVNNQADIKMTLIAIASLQVCTPFMARLHEQIKYFLNKKISEDPAWRQVQVIFSGHDVPGEGEHKIMEYIRHAKTQKDYNPHIRHCIYGLDADLIMLGLLSHEPHFCLLREENQIGFQNKPSASFKDQRFHLLHIALFRDYLNWEFSCLQSMTHFKYDIQRIIDDFILLCIFVGNDFLPHLPYLHIDDGAIGLLFRIYKKVLPQAGGYLNDSGTLHPHRLQLILDELVSHEDMHFESASKRRRIRSGKPGLNYPLKPVQRGILQQVETFLRSNQYSPSKSTAKLVLPGCHDDQDRRLLRDLADNLNLWISFDNDAITNAPLITLGFGQDESIFTDPALGDMDRKLDGTAPPLSLGHRTEELLRKYKRTARRFFWDESADVDDKKFTDSLCQWKRAYYSVLTTCHIFVFCPQKKMQVQYSDSKQLDKMTHAYIEGLQWVLHYYYKGVASWITLTSMHELSADFTNVASYQFSFKLGSPFKPFEQLMSVLPAASSVHVPPAFRDLMTKPESPIHDLYPSDFETDLNGKRSDWQAIAKIPFIDEERLLNAMKGPSRYKNATSLGSHEHNLEEDELQRNRFGHTLQFQYNPHSSTLYPSALPSHFPHIDPCYSQMTVYHLPIVPEYIPTKLEGMEEINKNIEKLVALCL